MSNRFYVCTTFLLIFFLEKESYLYYRGRAVISKTSSPEQPKPARSKGDKLPAALSSHLHLITSRSAHRVRNNNKGFSPLLARGLGFLRFAERRTQTLEFDAFRLHKRPYRHSEPIGTFAAYLSNARRRHLSPPAFRRLF